LYISGVLGSTSMFNAIMILNKVLAEIQLNAPDLGEEHLLSVLKRIANVILEYHKRVLL
jgi:hypothetical protein